ncbi:MAG TPA: class I SAM-dependent methyltransferase [Chitinophagaceae bacterium]|nr:class I SAM-dependent methyltransferase [Chitinophagaceae bacterium]
MAETYQPNNDVFFKSSYKEVWKQLIPPGLTEAESYFIADVSHLQTGGSIVDIMCGYGRHALSLAGNGYKVTAIDSLPEYIDELKSTAEHESLDIIAHVGDITTVSLDSGFDAAICMGNCFSVLNKIQAKNVLSKLFHSLNPGGTFIINSWMIGEIAIKHFEARSWLYVGEYKYLLENRYLLNPSRIETDHILIKETGETEILKAVDYILTFSELSDLLEEAGFRTEEVFSTPRKKKYQFGDKQAYIVARKK